MFPPGPWSIESESPSFVAVIGVFLIISRDRLTISSDPGSSPLDGLAARNAVAARVRIASRRFIVDPSRWLFGRSAYPNHSCADRQIPSSREFLNGSSCTPDKRRLSSCFR